MLRKIFVSHSQRDKEIRKTFNEIAAIAGLQTVCMEFEDMQAPKWEKIKNDLNVSEAVFLLLGKNVTRNRHTQNWISFEVGLACAFDKRIWVLENIASKLNFPIPYVTDYMRYESLEKKELFDYVRKILEGYGEYGENVYFRKVGDPTKHIPNGKKVRCPKCDSTFNLHNAETSPLIVIKTQLLCPLCRQEIKV